jgi:hypothetical protein
MKRPQPDIGELVKNQFIGNLSTTRKLKRLWGTTAVDGVEVLHHRQYHYPENRRFENFERLYGMLGILNDIKEASFEGVDSAWLYFNKNIAANLVVNSNDFVANNLNKLFWDSENETPPADLSITTSIVISTIANDKEDQIAVDNLINVSMTKEALIQAIEDNYEDLWDKVRITQEGVGVVKQGTSVDPVTKAVVSNTETISPDDPWLDALSRYVLRTNGLPCTITDVSVGTLEIYSNPFIKNQNFYNTIVVDIEIPYNEFNPGEAFVQSIASDLSFTYDKDSKSNGYITKKAVQQMDARDLEDDPDIANRNYILWEDESVEDNPLFASLWYKKDNIYYLRASALTNPASHGLKYKDVVNYILPLIDTGYKKKKVPWWKKAVAIIVFIIALVLALPTGGKSLSLVKVAAAIVAASMVLVVFTLVLAATGQHEWASAFMEAQQFLEPLVMIATLILMFDATAAARESAKQTVAKQMAAEETGKAIAELAVEEIAAQAAKVTTSDIVFQMVSELATNFADEIVKGATDVFAGNVTTNAAVKFTAKVLELLTLPFNLKLKSINERNKDLASEYAELTKETNQEYDALQGFMNIYAKPATADWSIYAATFDQPYERGGGPLALGNIQRTTKQAIRKTSYDDPAFDSILII